MGKSLRIRSTSRASAFGAMILAISVTSSLRRAAPLGLRFLQAQVLSKPLVSLLLQHGELQHLVLLLLSAGESLVDVPRDHLILHAEQGHLLLESLAESKRGDLLAPSGLFRRTQESDHRDPRDLGRVLESEEQAVLSPLVRRPLADVLAMEANLPLRDDVAGPAHQDLGERGLPRAVRSHERVDLALADRQVDPFQDLIAFHLDMEILDLQRRRLCLCSRLRHSVNPPNRSGRGPRLP